MNSQEKTFTLGRLDIVDLYQWHKQGKLEYKTYFQRQAVWRDSDRQDLIDTILKELPIPAIFICDAGTNFETLEKKYNVLDGRQRLESIFDFLDNKFELNGKKFSRLSDAEKESILSYNIMFVQMYLKPEDTEKIKEIFKRLNKNSYNLNRIEKQSAQLVEFDFMIISKIITGFIEFEQIDDYLLELEDLFSETEEEYYENEITVSEASGQLGGNSNRIKRICKRDNIQYIKQLFCDDKFFNNYEQKRQISLQHFMNIFACILEGGYIKRNVSESRVKELSALPEEELLNKIKKLNEVSKILLDCYAQSDEFWYRKPNIFTLSCSLANNFSHILTVEDIQTRLSEFIQSNSKQYQEYLRFASTNANDKQNREKRADIIEKVLFNK